MAAFPLFEVTLRASVYVDGFNLYYGLKHYERQGRLYKWLDLAALCRAELPNDAIQRIRYCTALIQPRLMNPQQDLRQQTYLRALRTIPNLSIDYGHFLQSHVWMPLRHPPVGGNPLVEVVKTEEKGSDVNLATRLLCDGFAGDYDIAVIISNDSDLCMPIEVVRKQLKRQVGVLNPTQRFSSALRRVTTFYKKIRETSLAASQFPPMLRDAQGTISTPAGW
ncbi:MAG: NYN domain-containing protein [Chloroflexi bacterium]|nr:NYN domain-containing protein [Chloroflexota bacterium]